VLTVPVLCWSIFSRHRPANLAFAVMALTAAAAPFADSNGLDPRLLRWSERYSDKAKRPERDNC
jgi:hypothetical protein